MLASLTCFDMSEAYLQSFFNMPDEVYFELQFDFCYKIGDGKGCKTKAEVDEYLSSPQAPIIMIAQNFKQIDMKDQSNPIIDTLQVTRTLMRPDLDYILDFSLQVNTFTDNDSIVGIFTSEPEPFNFFSVD